MERSEAVGVGRPDGLSHFGPDATEPISTVGLDNGRVPRGPAAATETRPGEFALPDPTSNGLVINPELSDHPGHVPEFIGEWGETERAVGLMSRHRHGLPSGAQF